MLSHDLRIEWLVPAEVKTVMYSSLSMSRTGNEGQYQRADAVIEELNKEAKKWVTFIFIINSPFLT